MENVVEIEFAFQRMVVYAELIYLLEKNVVKVVNVENLISVKKSLLKIKLKFVLLLMKMDIVVNIMIIVFLELVKEIGEVLKLENVNKYFFMIF